MASRRVIILEGPDSIARYNPMKPDAEAEYLALYEALTRGRPETFPGHATVEVQEPGWNYRYRKPKPHRWKQDGRPRRWCPDCGHWNINHPDVKRAHDLQTFRDIAKAHVRDRNRAPCIPAALEGGCRGCGGEVIPPRLYYCPDDECKRRFEADHFWDTARAAAIDRQRVWPLVEPAGWSDWASEESRSWLNPQTHLEQWADAFGSPDWTPERHYRWVKSHRHQPSLPGWPWPVCSACGERIVQEEPEVNHIRPVNGDRQNFSCHHHQDNLETVHRRCHVEITNEQRRLGLIGKVPTGPLLGPPVPDLFDIA